VEAVTVESLMKGFGSGDWTRCVLRDSTRGELRVDLESHTGGSGCRMAKKRRLGAGI
jgi:hypothetical protein